MGGKRLLGGLTLAAAIFVAGQGVAASDGPGLTSFGSTAELNAFLAARAPQEAGQDEPLCPPDQPDCDKGGLSEIILTGSVIAATPSITNNQQAGVDEGDVVKARGDTLIILRRGRLFTVSTANGRLRPVDSIDAYPPGVDALDDWYDEMLVSGDRVVVIGYSYGRGGTEINRFLLDAAGNLTFEDSHHLSSEDYYSSRNYASRLVGDQLIVYTPVEAGADDPLKDVPTLSRWRPGQDKDEDSDAEGRAIIAPTDIYRAPGLDLANPRDAVIHTAIRCDLAAVELTCRATAILGPESRSYYVAPTAIYVWMSEDAWDQPKGEMPDAWLYRIPLDGGRPQAAATQGTPIDQFSFREAPEGGRIDVMVVSDGEGDGMWGVESAQGKAALLRLPFARFGDGAADLEPDDYRILPALPRNRNARNRFVGDHLLYSGTVYNDVPYGDDVTPRREGQLTIVPLNGDPLVRFTLPGDIGRIDQMGPDAIVVSGEDDAFFTTVELQTPRPTIGDQFVLVGSEETEDRSHAFFYRPDATSADGSQGVLGLPVTLRSPEDPEGRSPASDGALETITYLRRDPRGRLGSLGFLGAGASGEGVDDGCVASCYDWYGDARPIFLGQRIFALLGYEVVEGRERAGRIRELRRIDLTPPPPPGPRPYYPD